MFNNLFEKKLTLVKIRKGKHICLKIDEYNFN